MSNFYATNANGGEFKSKKALREFVASTPDQLVLQDTSAFSNRGVQQGIAGLTPSDVIVGPNPWNARNWYANVNAKGRVV